ncbi:1-deoxy-D-xylulose-5-phosphate synthase [Methylophilaceae bacterium]|nr:1-deoxy-D-xylulose-5-phosphate synthase [Methylophilaceae bacterium]
MDELNSNLLDQVNSLKDLKKLGKKQLPILASEIREFLIKSVQETGGHLASNLGVVELTIALHYIFNSPKDILIWDVGHQTYTHKILTGRKNQFSTLRQYLGLSGFPKRDESDHDHFGTGHSSTSISAAFGMAEALNKQRSNSKSIAIIGDGALTAGMAFEALNNAGNSKSNILVILNDNDMSISKNVGALNNYLAKLLSGKIYGGFKSTSKQIFEKVPSILELAKKTEEHVKGMVTPGTLFEEFGFNYIGPIDGHNLDVLVDTLENINNLSGPQFLHVVTKKGNGFSPAEKDPNKFHGISKKTTLSTNQKTFTQVFGEWILDYAKKDKSLVAITPAMSDGSGLTTFAKKYPSRFYDVGIAEQHAVTFAAGLALKGFKPVVAIYSTFMQRAYDQIIHDVALQKISMVFAVDRAGVVGADGPTHNGSFDISFIRCIPNTVIMNPINEQELKDMLSLGYKSNKICFIRYPRGYASKLKSSAVKFGKSVEFKKGKKLVFLCFGPLMENVIPIAEKYNYAVINMRFSKPIDQELILAAAKKYKYIVTIEDNTIAGGAGSSVLELLSKNNIQIKTLLLGYSDEFSEHGSQEEIHKNLNLDTQSIENKIVNFISKC